MEVPKLVVGHDHCDVVVGVIHGLLAILEGVVRVLEHRNHVLTGAHVEEVT